MWWCLSATFVETSQAVLGNRWELDTIFNHILCFTQYSTCYSPNKLDFLLLYFILSHFCVSLWLWLGLCHDPSPLRSPVSKPNPIWQGHVKCLLPPTNFSWFPLLEGLCLWLIKARDSKAVTFSYSCWKKRAYLYLSAQGPTRPEHCLNSCSVEFRCWNTHHPPGRKPRCSKCLTQGLVVCSFMVVVASGKVLKAGNGFGCVVQADGDSSGCNPSNHLRREELLSTY